MAWRDRYRSGSFRGVPFVTRAHDADFGRRGETTTYPGRDDPSREDLGRAPRRWAIAAFVIGADYMTGRDALIAAIEASGPGTLVHPFLGSFLADVETCHLAESTEEGGMARFDLVFAEPGVVLPPTLQADTAQASKGAADAAIAGAATRFDASFSTSGDAAPVSAKALATIGTIANASTLAATSLLGSGSPLMALSAGVALLGNADILGAGATQLLGVAGDVIDEASACAATIASVLGALGGLGDDSTAAIGAVASVAAAVSALPPVVATTPTRTQEAVNQQALADLTTVVAGGVAVAIAADTDFASYDDAVALRDRVSQWLDDQALLAADRGNDAMAGDLDTLRRAVVADITARGGTLARVFGYTPAIVSPALVLAWRLYRQPTKLLDQAADLVTRNRVRHPGFVPAAKLAVLTAGAANGQ